MLSAIRQVLWLAAIVLAGSLCAQPRLENIRQLTFGGQNAEAYWSPDGRRLIFQATRDGLGCDQMFIMNADGSDVRMVSTGKGRTTCGYFLPDGKHILYSSTHETDAACPPPPDRSQGYVWAVYPSYDIYLATDDGKILRKLTDTPGYDAEATVNWKTGRIVYTSMASGDLDLWSMKLDGTDKRRITSELGYDGGAVFSRDGERLVWRAFHPKDPAAVGRYKDLLARGLTSPMEMELFVARADGASARQITQFGCASFAPTFTPDGRRIVFSSNRDACGSRRFELYVVNADGTGLRRITSFGGFTSFPEFSPDGRKIVFVSDWKARERYEFNVFVADWIEDDTSAGGGRGALIK
jgi:Tol biopolymer transport system component